MHGALAFAALLGLIALAFGHQAAVHCAQAILIIGTVAVLFVTYLIVFERLV